MNVLLFVLSILAMLAIMTYARLDTFLDFKGLQVEYKSFTQNEERSLYNEKQQKLYNAAHGKKGELVEDFGETEIAEEVEDPKEKGEKLNGALQLGYFVDKTLRESHPKDYQQMRTLTLKLMDILYRQHPSFAEYYEKYPDLNALILDQLVQNSEQSIDANTLPKADSLSTIQLNPPQVHEAFYKMLKGNMPTRPKGMSNEEWSDLLTSTKIYRALIDFVQINSSKKPISIYLAPLPLLEAIYGKGLAADIASKRYSLYLSVRREEITTAAAKTELERQYNGKQSPDIDSAMLSFGVSKTTPPK